MRTKRLQKLKKMIEKSGEQNMLHQEYSTTGSAKMGDEEAFAVVLGAIKFIITMVPVFQLLVVLVEVAGLEEESGYTGSLHDSIGVLLV